MKYYFIILCAIVFQTAESQNRAPSLYLNYQDHERGDIIINSLRVQSPSPLYTYYCGLLWNSGHDAGGYCGMQEHPNGKNFIFSLWDPISSKDPITAEYAHPDTEVANFGGEGTGLRSINFGLGWEEGQWYTILSRAWSEYESSTFFGYWVFDQKNKKWHHLVTMDYPVPSLDFKTSTRTFIEDWLGNGDEARTFHQQNGWKRKSADHSWIPFSTTEFHRVYPDAGTVNYIEQYDGGKNQDYFYMTSGGGTIPRGDIEREKFTMDSSKDAPHLNHGILTHFTMTPLADQMFEASWTVDESGLPQFLIFIQVFDEEGNMYDQRVIQKPHVRSLQMDMSEYNDGSYTASMVMIDLLDNESNLLELSFHVASNDITTEEKKMDGKEKKWLEINDEVYGEQEFQKDIWIISTSNINSGQCNGLFEQHGLEDWTSTIDGKERKYTEYKRGLWSIYLKDEETDDLVFLDLTELEVSINGNKIYDITQAQTKTK